MRVQQWHGDMMNKSKFNLLIVDDIAVNIDLLSKILGQEGYRVFSATSGKQAIELAMRNDIDLMLLDIIMPGMDGFQVCRKLKAESDTREIPVIFITAKTDENDIVKGFDLGAVDYITKPFRSAELIARVKTHLELRLSKQLINDQSGVLAKTNQRLLQKNQELQHALFQVETLKGLLPVCSHCKRIRNDHTDTDKPPSWISLELYLHNNTAAEVTHSVCPDCMVELYPELMDPEVS